MYKSQFSPLYISYSPIIEQLLQVKLKSAVKISSVPIQPIHKTRKFHESARGEAKEKKIEVCISGFAKTLQMRNVRAHESAR